MTYFPLRPQHDEPPPLPSDLPPVPEQFTAPSDKTPPLTREPLVEKPTEKEPTPTRSPVRQAPSPPPSSQEPALEQPVATATKETSSKGKRKSFFKFGSKK